MEAKFEKLFNEKMEERIDEKLNKMMDVMLSRFDLLEGEIKAGNERNVEGIRDIKSGEICEGKGSSGGSGGSNSNSNSGSNSGSSSQSQCASEVTCTNLNDLKLDLPANLWTRFTDLEAKMCYVINELTYFRSAKFHNPGMSADARMEMRKMEEKHPQWKKDLHNQRNLTRNYAMYSDDKKVVQSHNVVNRDPME